ncbi:hypothetical protein SAMN05444372_107188 [Flavobacterium micromati]|jgi:hypothetical protein|uniref:Uncharacterized protein n=1 Tax=Flavobacterium micromati TaxID=229205 RepID=A0A1M5L2W1_9FLAO|nr:hypothetical protein SAMN05444372_107188 [Flavobacterium micromati]
MNNLEVSQLVKTFLISLMIGFFAGVVIGIKIYLK